MHHILATIDFSEISDAIVDQAAQLAEAFTATLHLIHVAAPNPDFAGYEAGPQVVRDARAQELRDEHQRLSDYAANLRERNIDAKALLVQGPTVETILNEARSLNVDLIIVGSHGKGAFYRALLGSVSEGVVRGATQPVLVIPSAKMT